MTQTSGEDTNPTPHFLRFFRLPPRVEKILAPLLILISIGFLGAILFRSRAELLVLFRQMDLRYFLLAGVSALLATFLGGITWAFVQRGYDLGFGFSESMGIHFVSAITKYLPGYVWQYLGKGYLSSQTGRLLSTISVAILTEFILLILGGVAFAGLVAWRYSAGWQVLSVIPRWVWGVGCIATLMLLVGWVTASLRAVNPSRRWSAAFNLSVAFLVGLIGWVFFILSCWLVARALLPVEIKTLPQIAFALIVSMTAGILVIFVPGGIGVRETALAFLLGGIVPLATAAAISLLLRFVVILAELSFLLIGLMLSPKARRWIKTAGNSQESPN